MLARVAVEVLVELVLVRTTLVAQEVPEAVARVDLVLLVSEPTEQMALESALAAVARDKVDRPKVARALLALYGLPLPYLSQSLQQLLPRQRALSMSEQRIL